jgi:hypothetical protein
LPLKPTSIRLVGQVPSDYTGPVYYRTQENLNEPWGRSRFRWNEPASKIEKLTGGLNRDGFVLKSGLVVDEHGALLPEWTTPLKARFLGGKTERVEYQYEGDGPKRISERLHDAIVSLEPNRHIFIPIDVTNDDGIERQYLLFVGKSFFWGDVVLHPSKNRLQPKTYVSGSQGYESPSWVQSHSEDRHGFGYLNGRVVDGLHYFAGGSVMNNGCIFSPELFDKIAGFGDIFEKPIDLVPMGICVDEITPSLARTARSGQRQLRDE